MLKRLSVAKLLAVMMFATLSGCTTTNPVIDTFTTLLPWRAQYADIQPGFEYLVVELDGKASVMALGSRNVVGQGDFALTNEYWYNGQGEMLHLQNGRIQHAIGTTREIRKQEGKVPAWRDIDNASRALSWVRELDVMPSYRFSFKETLISYKTAAPASAPKEVLGEVIWFADEVSSTNEQNKPWHYKQLFALQNGKVVYSEQCIAPSLCLKLRPLAGGKQP